ncbi:MAG: OsmC family protein [candidate division Zixibacteria bacterium]|nr:OsmC family protein [candidate division Zixibacteria bacterium]
MKIHNVDMDKIGQFIEEVKKDPSKALKSKKVSGEWNLKEDLPQFQAKLEFALGDEMVFSDQAPFMGGEGRKPDPIQYCLYGLCACYAATFVSLANLEGINLRGLRVSAENQVDLSKTLGLSDNPIVKKVKITVEVSSDVSLEKLKEIEKLAQERCPGVFCLTNPILLETEIKNEGKNE